MDNKRVKKPKKAKSKILGNNIKELLEKKGMIAKELCDISGIPPSFLSRIINGQRLCISLPIALKICTALCEPVESVFTYKRAPRTK